MISDQQFDKMKAEIVKDLRRQFDQQVAEYEGKIESLNQQISILRTEKAQLQDAMKNLEVDGKKIGAGFRQASTLSEPSTAMTIPAMQAGELFEKARQLVKMRNSPGIHIAIKKIGDKYDSVNIEVKGK